MSAVAVRPYREGLAIAKVELDDQSTPSQPEYRFEFELVEDPAHQFVRFAGSSSAQHASFERMLRVSELFKATRHGSRAVLQAENGYAADPKAQRTADDKLKEYRALQLAFKSVTPGVPIDSHRADSRNKACKALTGRDVYAETSDNDKRVRRFRDAAEQMLEDGQYTSPASPDALQRFKAGKQAAVRGAMAAALWLAVFYVRQNPKRLPPPGGAAAAPPAAAPAAAAGAGGAAAPALLAAGPAMPVAAVPIAAGSSAAAAAAAAAQPRAPKRGRTASHPTATAPVPFPLTAAAPAASQGLLAATGTHGLTLPATLAMPAVAAAAGSEQLPSLGLSPAAAPSVAGSTPQAPKKKRKTSARYAADNAAAAGGEAAARLAVEGAAAGRGRRASAASIDLTLEEVVGQAAAAAPLAVPALVIEYHDEVL